jgi:DHA2 family multidrug resistance protein
VLSSVPPKDVPAASAFFNLSRQIGGSIAIAVLVTILVRSTVSHRADLASAVTLASPAVSQYIQRNGSASSAAPQLSTLVDQQAIVLAYADTARATAAITFLLLPCVLLMRRQAIATAPISE